LHDPISPAIVERVRSNQFVVAGLVALAIAAASEAATASEPSGVKGRVIDVTCYGPCAPETYEGEPYSGEATIVARRLPEGGRAAAVTVDDSRFRTGLRPGRYLVKVKIEDPCWARDSKEIRVQRGAFEWARLKVSNECIR
jgi:hypothetical protein